LLSSVSAADPEVSVSLSDYSNFGKPGRIHYPAFTTNIHYFTRTGRVDAIHVPDLMNLNYSYSRAGDVTLQSDSIRNFSYTYGYDNLHRLTGVGGPGPFRQQACHIIDLYYETFEPHAVSRVVVNGEEHNLYYENNGNLTNGYDFSTSGQFPERRLDYNAENMPLTIDYEPQGGSVTTTTLTYDGEDRRVKKQTAGDLVIYVDNTYEIRNGQAVKYIFAGDQRLAQVTGGTVQYYHKDHLGSSTIMTDADGLQVESTQYLPYGLEQTQPGLQKTSYKFTDQEHDQETGLYNYDARLYDPVVGRFISPDSIIPNIYNPQSLNRYSYARNNPLIYTDPSGHQEVYEHFDIRQFIRQLFGIHDRVKDFSAPETSVPMLDPDQKQRQIGEAAKQTQKTVDKINTISDAIASESEGEKGARTDPADLQEKLALDEAKSGAGEVYPGELEDPKYHPETGTHTKMKYNHPHDDGTSTEIHYDIDRSTGEGSGYKIKDDTNANSRGHLYPYLKKD
jgi:RHS repeat-associated protein